MKVELTELYELPAANELLVRLEYKEGVTTIIPVCGLAKLFANLIGQPYIPRGSVSIIKALGYRVKVAQTLPEEL